MGSTGGGGFSVKHARLPTDPLTLPWHYDGCGCHIRDLKPSNILLTSQGTIKVGDLGLSQFTTTANSNEPGLGSPSSRPGKEVGSKGKVPPVLGTPYFLSPEICKHEPFRWVKPPCPHGTTPCRTGQVSGTDYSPPPAPPLPGCTATSRTYGRWAAFSTNSSASVTPSRAATS